MKRMNNIVMDNNFTNTSEFVVPESLFESLDQLDYGHFHNNNSGVMEDSLLELMNTDLMTSDTMASFLEMETVKEVEPVKPAPRPSVIMKNNIKKKEPAPCNLSEILTSCGIEYDLVGETDQSLASPSSSELSLASPSSSELSLASPRSSLGSEMEQTQDLIEELEEFFIKTEGSPTQVSDNALEMLDKEMNMVVENNKTTNLVTEDGQNVIIIIAPSSPADNDPVSDSDPEWSPVSVEMSAHAQSSPGPMRPRKKYARSKPPQAPVGPYPTDRKERKKAQNRTAAFRYREKMKSQQDTVEGELEALEERNTSLKEQFSEMETEFKYLKKLMTEAGLGHYAAAVNF